MVLEAGRPYMSIGEILNVLKDEFPDVTVSKIRYLESEGLIQPERTSSGYRKFSTIDVERLRFILRQQRDQFWPLKVIRERLAEWEAAGGPNGTVEAAPASEDAEPAPVQTVVDEDPFRGRSATGVSLSEEELARASGLEQKQISELRTYGLLSPKETGGEVRFTENDLEVARLCRELIKLGLEPRHLRMFRSTVDRWAGLADQMVMPLIRQRNPEARRHATETVRELTVVGTRLLQALLREGLSAYA